MEVQSECLEPPVAPQCDPQPAGKINKAAFKLFGKRRTGSGMASFFSFRNKGATNSGNNGNSDNGNSLNGNSSAASVELVRSKTHDGLTSSNNDADGQRGDGLASLEAGPVRSLSKSLSFFSLLRRGSFRSSENGGAGLVRRGRGLKGFFSSMRWRRKEKTNEGDGEEVEGKKEKDGDTTDSEKVKDITLTLEPPPHHHQEDCGNAEAGHNLQAAETPTTSVTITPPHCAAIPGPSGELDSPFPYTPTDSPLRPPIQKAKASISSLTPSLATPPLDRCSTGDPPSEPSVDRLCSLLFTDVTSLKSFDSLTGCGDIIADADEEGPVGNGGSGTSSSSSGGGGGSVGVSTGRAVGMTSAACRGSPSKPSVSSQLTQPMFSVSPSSVSASLPARTRAPPPPQQHPAGSGVVAYMGGGEEMASPEGVDDADMQGLWHMLPSTGDNSPALPRSHQPSSTTPTSTYPPRTNPTSCHLPSASRSADRKVPQVKALGLSKIPIVGGAGSRAAKPPLPHSHGRHPTSPGEKEPLSDEGYWDTPSATPTATPDESGLQRNQKMALSRDSCSGDHLYDLYNDPEEEGEDQGEDEDLNSTPSPSTEYKMSPTSQTTPPSSSSSSSFRSMKGSASLPRESKIPVSNKQQTPPPHSVSQSALSSVLEAESPQPKTQAPPPARTRIPVSKVPVRRSGNKPGSTTRGPSHKK
ncbi:APC membrane recruitment protein 2 [Acanthochromis polyacanthus]|uniref:APC membrane recruitment protein 2 n=1 Tax=Acanthochromis polyacanthus TaxID=80966 RepID=UPI002234D48D|nr:APC membrane recruitment protein 2 [Acanthochromis polyacanthus]